MDQHLFFFTLTALAFIMMPGPDFAFITKTTLASGYRAGQATACGIASGLIVHTLAAVLGLSALIAQSAFLFNLMKYAGAAYLFYIGIQSITAKKSVPPATLPKEPIALKSYKKYFCGGFFVNVMNPKAILFNMTFLPQFVIAAKPVIPQLFLLGFISVTTALVWFMLLARFMNSIRTFFTNEKVQFHLQKVTGILLISFGFKLFFQEK